MSAKAKSKLTPEQQKATMTRVLQKIKPYGFFVVCSLIVAAVSVAAQLYIPILCGSAIDMMLGKGAVDFAGVLRIIYVFALFGAFGTFDALMNIYPVTWGITGATMLGLYVFARRRAYAQVAARKGVKLA